MTTEEAMTGIQQARDLVAAVYVSSAVAPFTPQELLELLRRARQDNEAAGITGMLLYRSGNFIQTIEGPAAAVDTLLKRIACDPRRTATLRASPASAIFYAGSKKGRRPAKMPASR